MRLKGDKIFMGLLNNIRVSDCPKNNIKQFRLRKIDLNSVRLRGIEIFADVTVCSCHVTYAFESVSTLYSCLNVKELLARSRREI